MIENNNPFISSKELELKIKNFKKPKFIKTTKVEKENKTESLTELKLRIDELKDIIYISKAKFKHDHHGVLGTKIRKFINSVVKKLGVTIISPQENYNERLYETLQNIYRVLEENQKK
jgi:hypothetical protein